MRETVAWGRKVNWWVSEAQEPGWRKYPESKRKENAREKNKERKREEEEQRGKEKGKAGEQRQGITQFISQSKLMVPCLL